MARILGIGSRVRHTTYGAGVVTNVTAQYYWITFIDGGLETLPIDETLDIVEAVDGDLDTVSFYEVEKSLRNLLKKYSDISEVVPIADKWKGGTLTLTPKDTNLSSKEIPMETFFHKIVMVRDRVRVMEQKINASKVLEEHDKVDLQQYITRIYGSLTTFNVLFKNASQNFKGASTKT